MKKALILFFIFFLAFFIRLTYLTDKESDISSDEITYDTLALSLAESKGFATEDGTLTSQRPPLYPAFLALAYKVFGHSYFAVRFIQAIMGAFTVCILYVIAESIFNRPTAILTGIFSSFYMTFVMCTKLLYTETLFTLLLVSIVYLVIRADDIDIKRFLTLGLLCGLLSLIRSAAFLLPFIMIMYLIMKIKKRTTLARSIVTIVLAVLSAFTIVILPWTVRNYKIHKKLVVISTNAGMNMYVAVKPAWGKIIGLGPRGDAVSEQGFGISDEIVRDKFFMKAAFNAYKEDPFNALKMFVLRFLFFWNIIDWEIISGNIINYHYIFIFPLAFLGVLFSFKNKKEILFILCIILYFTSLTLFFQGTPRYRMPIDGFIILLGSYGILELINRQKNKTMPVFCISTYFVFTFLLYKYSVQTKYFLKELMEKIGLW